MLIQVLRKGSKSCTTTGNRRVTLITNSRDNSRKKNGGPNNDYATDNRTGLPSHDDRKAFEEITSI
jgi:hypothetical protein